jgi:copper(I)-binding protein/uncharacterized protein YcnI
MRLLNLGAALLALPLAGVLPGAAHAHASISPADVVNFSTVRAVITFEHGCDGAPTTEVILTIPEGFITVKPIDRKGWESAVTEGQYAATYHIDGVGDVSSGVTEIRWSGGSTPDDRPARFMFEGIMQSFNDQTFFAFPATQICGTDGKIVWDEVPTVEGPELEHPAPYMTVSFEQIGENGPPVETADVVVAGDLEISAAFARATLPNAPVGGGYLTITNTGGEADRLVSVTSPVAAMTALHQMKMEGDMMKMGELPEGVVIPAGETVTLAPGGMHIMFMNLTQPLVEGETVPVTLTFEKAGPVEVMLSVAGTAADTPAGEHGHH